MRNFLRHCAAAPAALRDTDSWKLVDPTDPPGLPERWRRVSGPWRADGQPMHGLYTRPADDPELVDQVDGMAVLNGWRAGFWRGPAALAGWSSPLVSYWNPLLAQNDGRLSLASWLDHDEYTVDAVIGGFKPYGYLSCTRGYAREVFARAADAPFGVAVNAGWGGLSLARTDSLATLYDGGLIPDLMHAYADVLPADVFHRHVLPLADPDITAAAPADFLESFEALEDGPLARLGLVLGYPPLVTAGSLQRPQMWAERGSLPTPTWRPATGGQVR